MATPHFLFLFFYPHERRKGLLGEVVRLLCHIVDYFPWANEKKRRRNGTKDKT